MSLGNRLRTGKCMGHTGCSSGRAYRVLQLHARPTTLRCYSELTYAPARLDAAGADHEGAPLAAGALREVAGPAMLTEARRRADLPPPGELLAAEAAAAC